MSNMVKLKRAIIGKKTISYEKKPELWAKKCDCCGAVFVMNEYCNDKLIPGEMKGTFSECATGKNGKGLGNMFHATVCSLDCADKIFKGAWKNMNEYKPYKKIKAILIRIELGLTVFIKTEKDLINEWENK